MQTHQQGFWVFASRTQRAHLTLSLLHSHLVLQISYWSIDLAALYFVEHIILMYRWILLNFMITAERFHQFDDFNIEL